LVDPGAPFAGPAYLDRLEAELRRRGIDVLNGLPVLRPFAAQDLSRAQLSYYREDHHWTPLGVQRIAAALIPALRAKLGAGH
jgi:hypothetical protein